MYQTLYVFWEFCRGRWGLINYSLPLYYHAMCSIHSKMTCSALHWLLSHYRLICWQGTPQCYWGPPELLVGIFQIACVKILYQTYHLHMGHSTTIWATLSCRILMHMHSKVSWGGVSICIRDIRLGQDGLWLTFHTDYHSIVAQAVVQ